MSRPLLIIIALFLSIQVFAIRDSLETQNKMSINFNIPYSALFNNSFESKYDSYKYILGLECSFDVDYNFYSQKKKKFSKHSMKVSWFSISLMRYESLYDISVPDLGDASAHGTDIYFDFGFSIGPNLLLNSHKARTHLHLYSQTGAGLLIKNSEIRYYGLGSSEDTHANNTSGYNLNYSLGLNISGKKILVGMEYKYNWYKYNYSLYKTKTFACHLFCLKLGITIGN